MKPSGWQIFMVLVVGILGVSMSAILVRLSIAAMKMEGNIGFSLFLAASRLIISALILLPTWKNLKFTQITPKAYYYAIAAGICLAIHFATWITSLAFTSIAASTVLVTTNPIWVGFFSWWWFKEKLSKRAILGIAIAFLGGMVIAIADSSGISGKNYDNPILGDALALFGAVMSSLYIIFGSQAQQQGLNIGNYIAIAYSTAAIFLLPLPFLYQTSYFGYSYQVYIYILLMAIVSQLIGHTSFNWAIRWISPTLISLSLLFEPIFASCLGAIAFSETIPLMVFWGGLMILIGTAIVLW